MSNNHNRERELQLDNHIAALRDEPTPDGPSAQLMQMTMKQIDSVTGRRTIFERLVHMTLTQKIAAAVLFTLGALTLYFMFMLFSATSSIAFAEVAAKLKAACMLSYQSTATLAGQPPMTIKTLVSDPNRMRSEMPGGIVNITVGDTFLILNPSNKTATVTTMNHATSRPAPTESSGMAQLMRSLGGMKGEPLGDKIIDGVASQGFKSRVGNQTLTIWADKKTAMPVRVETAIPSANGETLVVMDHFELDPPMDESLFSLEVPEGYSVTKQTYEVPKLGKPEDAVVDVLRGYAEGSKGSFPAALTDWAAYFKARHNAKPDEKFDAGKIGAVAGMLYTLPNGYEYAGKGVKLGEKDKIVFWYQPDKKKPIYKAIFGDLRIEDVTKDKLPATQPASAPAVH